MICSWCYLFDDIFFSIDHLWSRIAWAKTSFFRFYFKLHLTIHNSCESNVFSASHLHRDDCDLIYISTNMNYVKWIVIIIIIVWHCHIKFTYSICSSVLFIALYLRYAHIKCTHTHIDVRRCRYLDVYSTSVKWPQVLKIRLGVNVEWVFVQIDKSFWCCAIIVRCQRNNCHCTFCSRKQTVKWNINVELKANLFFLVHSSLRITCYLKRNICHLRHHKTYANSQFVTFKLNYFELWQILRCKLATHNPQISRQTTQ